MRHALTYRISAQLHSESMQFYLHQARSAFHESSTVPHNDLVPLDGPGEEDLPSSMSATITSLIGNVIATEKEHAKAVKARLRWKEAGDKVKPWNELREWNLLETLTVDEGMPEMIDLLLLDNTLLSQHVPPNLQ